jgi:hypothetical protein
MVRLLAISAATALASFVRMRDIAEPPLRWDI